MNSRTNNIGELFGNYKAGQIVYCKPTELPNVITLNPCLIQSRKEGLYKIESVFFPDTKRFPMVQFLICSDDSEEAVFSILEAKILHSF